MKNRIYNLIIIIFTLFISTTSVFGFSFRNMTLDFIHISDTHITDRDDTSYKALGSSKELLKDAINQINDIEGLDFVLFTGDLVDYATKENYYNYYYLLTKLKYPSLNTFGNHDFWGMTKEEALEEVKKYNPSYSFSDSYYAFSPKTDYRIIILDATIKDRKTSNGELPPEQLEFLDNELSQSQDKIVVIALHHPPVEPFVANEHALLNAKEFNDILLKYKNPIVVLSGHYHAAKIRRIGNITYVSTPSTVTYPMAFRHIKIVNFKDRVQFDFNFIQTKLDDVLEQNRQNVISYATLAGNEKDRELSFVYYKKHPKSARYKKNKIKNAQKTTKASKRELKKLSTPKKDEPKLKEKKIKEPKVKEPKIKEPKVKEQKVKPIANKEPKIKEPRAKKVKEVKPKEPKVKKIKEPKVKKVKEVKPKEQKVKSKKAKKAKNEQ